MGCKPEDGLLYFILLKSSQLTQAYEVARNIIVRPLLPDPLVPCLM